jgi:hypothetical protein
MFRLIAVAFALTLAASAQAMPVTPLHQSDSMVTQVREACGAGRVRINGVCVAPEPPSAMCAEKFAGARSGVEVAAFSTTPPN